MVYAMVRSVPDDMYTSISGLVNWDLELPDEDKLGNLLHALEVRA